MAKLLITIGVVLVIVGLLWPLLAKLGLGRLPGDIAVERNGFRFYVPITTGILLSVILSALFWLFRR